MAFMREVGCEMSTITSKFDNEPFLVALVDVVRARAARGACRTSVERSPAHTCKSNAVIEESRLGMCRTLKSALEEVASQIGGGPLCGVGSRSTRGGW